MYRWKEVLLVFVFLESLQSCNGSRIKPKELAKRAEKSASKMVDIAKHLEFATEEYPHPETIDRDAQAADELEKVVGEDAEKQAAAIKEEKQSSDNAANSRCQTPLYRRDYNAECPQGYSKPSWAPAGSCHRDDRAGSGAPSLVDFSDMSKEEKENWEIRHCIFFPPLLPKLRVRPLEPEIPGQPEAVSGATAATAVPRPGEVPSALTPQEKSLSGPVDSETEMPSCPSCNGTDIEYSEARGESYCTQCGKVLEENRMVESLSFVETSSGAHRAVGQFLPSSFGGGFAASYGSRESREQAIQRGYTNIKRIADKLRLSRALVEAAERIYLMGIQRGFTSGRLSAHIAAACLYISCRRERTKDLLIDFSDVLRVPVKVLGAVFIKLLKVLHIHVPVIDPSLFMERFAAHIDFGSQSSEVVQIGTRLVQAMGRDWIATGRRPSGLCGAALLIAARFKGIKINAEDICETIRMSSATINKRVYEWKHTATAKLKIEEFESTDLLQLPILRGPPRLEENERKKRRLLQLGDDVTNLANAENRSRAALQSSLRALFDEDDAQEELGQSTTERQLPTPVSLSLDINGLEDLCGLDPTPDSINTLAGRMLDAIQTTTKKTAPSGATPEGSSFLADPVSAPLPEAASASPPEAGPPGGASQSSTVAETQDLLEVQEDAVDLKALLLTSDEPQPLQQKNTENVSGDEEDQGESLSDVTDSEIDAMILSPEERRAKQLMWDELMKNVMPEVHRRWKEDQKKRRERGGVEGVGSSRRRNKKQRMNFGEAEPAASPADSVRLALEENSLPMARQLNGDALQSLFS